MRKVLYYTGAIVFGLMGLALGAATLHAMGDPNSTALDALIPFFLAMAFGAGCGGCIDRASKR